MMSDTRKTPIGNVYAQEMPRLNCHIFGQRKFLEAVAAAIQEALNGSPEHVGLNWAGDASEGEPYMIVAGVLNDEQISDLPDPFTDPAYRRPKQLLTPDLVNIPQVRDRMARHYREIDELRNRRD